LKRFCLPRGCLNLPDEIRYAPIDRGLHGSLHRGQSQQQMGMSFSHFRGNDHGGCHVQTGLRHFLCVFGKFLVSKVGANPSSRMVAFHQQHRRGIQIGARPAGKRKKQHQRNGAERERQ